MVKEFNTEPSIKVGLMSAARDVRFALKGRFVNDNGQPLDECDHTASIEDGKIKLDKATAIDSDSINISPVDFASSSITVHGVTIGIDFHWQRHESQSFRGALNLLARQGGITLINELPLESYLVSVISSEMSAACPAELLRAHAIVSRSWLLAQLSRRSSVESDQEGKPASDIEAINRSTGEIIRWYDRESHRDFDVCADDHCQRYQGISKAFSDEAFNAIKETRGKVIAWNDEICDARYSKSCGGMTESYRAAWEDKVVPYLASVYDGPSELEDFQMPLTLESNAERWIESEPAAYCNGASAELLARILPGFDQETRDFYRWTVSYSEEELAEILKARLGMDFGRVVALEPVERGESGRIIKLKIVGEKRTVMIGKELEIRRALSRSHLYSSAFVARFESGEDELPERFTLFGAGWGHGVGLCQIGAAVMADRGFGYEEILNHYFRGASVSALY